MLRVVHIDTGREWRGGQLQVFLLHRELLRRKVSSSLITWAGGELFARCRGAGLPVTAMNGRLRWSPANLSAARKAIRDTDIVHAHDPGAQALAAAAVIGRGGPRLVCHRRVSYPLGSSVGSRWKRGRVDRWIAVGESVSGRLQRSGVAADRIVVVPSAVDAEGFRRDGETADSSRLRAELGIDERDVVVGLTGALEPQKGHRVLIAAAPQILDEIPSAVFLMLGDGGLRNRLLAEVAGRGLDRAFRFAGFRRDVAAVTSLYTVSVLPSVDGEGSSAAIKESMALGVPVVASALQANMEVLGGCGIDVAVSDPEALADAVVRLLSDRSLGEAIGRLGRRRVEVFCPESMADAVLGAYHELMAEITDR